MEKFYSENSGICENIFDSEPPLEKKYDILFCGYRNPRREKILNELKLAGYNILHVTDIFGPALTKLIKQSKIFLNIHHNNSKSLETCRLNEAVMVSTTHIISEKGEGDKLYADRVRFVDKEDILKNVKELMLNVNYSDIFDVKSWNDIVIKKLCYICKLPNISNVIHITHNFGGGTQVYIENLCSGLKHNNNIIKKIINDNFYINYGSNDIIIIHHLLYIKNYKHHINKTIVDSILKKKPKKIMFIVHDYFLLYPESPNPIKNIIQEPFEDNILYLNYFFKNMDMIVFNSHNTFNNYSRYITCDYKYIITNNTPDIFLNFKKERFLVKKNIYNIGVLGHVGVEHKGKNLLHKIIQYLPNNYKFFLFGPEQSNFMYNNVTCYDNYKNSEIFDNIYKNNIDCFLFVSLFEETYSYTLSIAINTGLPIIYNNIGSYSERLQNRTNCIPFNESLITNENSNDNIQYILKTLITNNNNNNSNNNSYNIDCNISDFFWLVDENNTIKFDMCLIEQNLIHNNVCFIHFANIGNGYKILMNQINNIIKSGLYDKLDFIFITIVGPHIKLNNYNKIKVIYYSDNELEWEFPTIKRIKYFSDNIKKKVNILYIHTKGVLNKPYSYEWRKYLEYFLIEKHVDCLNLLFNYDCVGVNMQLYDDIGENKYRNHYSGNFWWSKSEYIKLLDNIDERISNNDRYYSEHFIIGKYYSFKPNKFVSLHQSKHNFYTHAIQKEEYSYEIIKNNILTKMDSHNNSYIEQNTPIIGIYYISAIKHYKYRFDKQLNLLIMSGLYNNLTQLLCFVSGEYCEEVNNILKNYSKIKIISTSENLYEKFAINNYKKYIDFNTNYNIFYMHTKGVSHSINNMAINDWCDLCNHFTINKWRLNVELLTYYDTVGINLKKYPKKHYSGNFWWSKSEYLLSLNMTIGVKYLDPEMYILSNENANAICLYNSISDHAVRRYHCNNYINLSVENILDKINCNPIYNIGDNNDINNSYVTW